MKITINANIHLHLPPVLTDDGVEEILSTIAFIHRDIMTKLDTSAAKEAQDTDAMVAALGHLSDALEQLRGNNNTALQEALDAANLDAEQQSAILDANDAAVDAALARANALLNPEPTVEPTGILVGIDVFDIGTVGEPLPNADPQINGGQAPYHVVATPTTQAGISIAEDGIPSGTPTEAGDFVFNYDITDSADPPVTGKGTVTVHVDPAQAPAPAGAETA